MTVSRSKVFLLSPANCGGMRARLIASPQAQFPLAQQMRASAGAPLGEIFSFVSGLYFRGKLAYARRFASPPDPGEPMSAGGVFIITANAGLRTPETPLTLASFRAFLQSTHRHGERGVSPLDRTGRNGVARGGRRRVSGRSCSAASPPASTSRRCSPSSVTICSSRRRSSVEAI
jgi:hypothetical protein